MAILLPHQVFNMVGVAQLVEHPVVVRDVAGSSPVAHPIFPRIQREEVCLAIARTRIRNNSCLDLTYLVSVTRHKWVNTLKALYSRCLRPLEL